MNKSGESIIHFKEYYKIDPSRIVIIHDEIDLAFGDVREKHKGGTAGHNGVESVKVVLGTDEFWRIRIGVGRPLDSSMDISDFVLSPFSKEEMEKLPQIFLNVTTLLEKYLAHLK